MLKLEFSILIDIWFSKLKIFKCYEKINNIINIYNKTFSNKSNLIFKNISPGIYTLRIIYDFNNNNLWDTGDVFRNIKPEKIKLYHPIEIRNNWDKELIINIL